MLNKNVENQRADMASKKEQRREAVDTPATYGGSQEGTGGHESLRRN